jgi:hypothetical protein
VGSTFFYYSTIYTVLSARILSLTIIMFSNENMIFRDL